MGGDIDCTCSNGGGKRLQTSKEGGEGGKAASQECQADAPRAQAVQDWPRTARGHGRSEGVVCSGRLAARCKHSRRAQLAASQELGEAVSGQQWRKFVQVCGP